MHQRLGLVGRHVERLAGNGLRESGPRQNGQFAAAARLVEHSAGGAHRVALGPDRAVGAATRELLDGVRQPAGEVHIDPTPQEVPWSVPLDQDTEHARYDAGQVQTYFEIVTRVALVLAAFRAPYRGRSTPVNAWWGSFDLAVSLFSGDPATPPSDDFIMRNAMDSQEVALGWWPGDPKHGGAAFYGYAHPARPGFSEADLGVPGARWDGDLGEYVLEWSDVVAADDPHGLALDFCRSVFAHACMTCGWDADLAASAEGTPPPVA